MKELFCLSCEHVFAGEDGLDHCPQCGSEAIEEVPPLDMDGHYEGAFGDPVQKYWKDSGIED